MPTDEARSATETPMLYEPAQRMEALPETPGIPASPVQQGTPQMPLQPSQRMEALPRQEGIAPLQPMEAGRVVEGTPLQPMESDRVVEGTPLRPVTSVQPVQQGTPQMPLQPSHRMEALPRQEGIAPLQPEYQDTPRESTDTGSSSGSGSAGGQTGGVTGVDTDAMKTAGSGLLDIQGRLEGIRGNLTNRLSAAGKAWGDDETGNSFYKQYGPSSTKELQGLQSAPQAVGDTYNGVMTMARGFEGTEEQNTSAVKGGPGSSDESGYDGGYGGHGAER